MTEIEKQILALVAKLKPQEKIETINNVSDYIRAKNRERITKQQFGRIVEERPDEIQMK